jgi:uncharacterized membrane protein YedE/YeeE
MKLIKFFAVGLLFGIVLSKAEVISWYRIQEMFRFQSFHMYGVIGSAVVLGVIAVQIIKRKKLKDSTGNPYFFAKKDKSFYRYILGGTIFGLGWVLTGSCPGPMYTLLGYGYLSFGVVIFSALVGTFVYGLVRKYLPH